MDENRRIVLVSGMSGAGKSTATRILEDMGYRVIDNCPVQLADSLVDLVKNSPDSKYQYVALSTNAQDFPDFLKALKSTDVQVLTLFVDASDDVLLKRYKSTRRIHPLLLNNTANTLEEAISVERQLFAKNINSTFVTIDTSTLTNNTLRTKIEEFFSLSTKPTFTLSFVSFGYKFGVPMDADLMVDVRFLPNPYWEEDLRTFTGNDDNVYHYVIDKEETQEFLKRFINFTDYAFAEYEKEGKNHFTVAIGCTGGQHRSVAITNYLYDYYKDKYHCYKEHREEKEWVHE